MSGRPPDYSIVWPKEIANNDPPEPGKAPTPTKTVWIAVGSAWCIGDPREGKIKLRVDSIPIGWDGALVLFKKGPPP